MAAEESGGVDTDGAVALGIEELGACAKFTWTANGTNANNAARKALVGRVLVESFGTIDVPTNMLGTRRTRCKRGSG